MDERLADLIEALSPVMTALQAEGFLHLTAFTRAKSPESLDLGDWPQVEEAVREALRGTASEDKADEVCRRLLEAFLMKSGSAGC